MKANSPTYVSRAVVLFLGLTFLVVVAASAQDIDTLVSGCPNPSGNSVCLTTYQGGVSRRGFNPNETALTQSAITATAGNVFHKQFSVAVNGAIYAQPLVLPNVVAGGTTYTDVAYVATEQDYVYAIDAKTGNTVWPPVNLLKSGYTYLNAANDLKGCQNILPNPGDVGVTGTPVIDISGNTGSNNTITSGTLYVVAKMRTPVTGTATAYAQWLYAIDITSGTVKASTQIGGSFNGIAFDTSPFGYSNNQNQRGALLAVPVAGQNPQVVITWASHCDDQNKPYSGWVMAYQMNSAQTALSQSSIWMSVPSNGTVLQGGIWQGGSGPAADSSGHIFFATGNGDSNLNVNIPPNDRPTSCTASPCDYGNSVVKMVISGGAFVVHDSFTTYDLSNRNTNDYDLGSGGLMLLPFQSSGNPQNLLTQAGKEGNVYLMRTSPDGYLGGYNGTSTTNNEKAQQVIVNAVCDTPGTECGVWGAPAWWTTSSGGTGTSGYAYFGGKNLGIRQYLFYPTGNACTGLATGAAGFCTTYSAHTSHTFGWPGPTPAISAPSASATKAIVWAIDTNKAISGGVANLWAFDAATLACLYSTDQSATSCTRVSATSDIPAGIAVKFTVPSVANGKVYIGTSGSPTTTQGCLNIYGLGTP